MRMASVRQSLVCAAGCADVCTDPELHRESAVLDDAHVGDIRGALGTIARHDLGPRGGWSARLKTLLAILGPGLIVMVGDNDAGAFGTYAQAGQDYGTALLWTLLLLIPVLYVNQEMVLRLGTVTGVGHARLILERFQRHRSVSAECAHAGDGVHRHQPGTGLSGASAPDRCAGGRGDHHRGGGHGELQAVRAPRVAAGPGKPAAGAHPAV